MKIDIDRYTATIRESPTSAFWIDIDPGIIRIGRNFKRNHLWGEDYEVGTT